MADGLGGYSIHINPVEAVDEGLWKCVATSAENVKQFTTCYVAMSSKMILLLTAQKIFFHSSKHVNQICIKLCWQFQKTSKSLDLWRA